MIHENVLTVFYIVCGVLNDCSLTYSMHGIYIGQIANYNDFWAAKVYTLIAKEYNLINTKVTDKPNRLEANFVGHDKFIWMDI